MPETKKPTGETLTDPAQGAEYLRISREVLASIPNPEATAAFLEEIAGRIGGLSPGVAEEVRQARARLGTGDEVRHQVSHGVPPLSTVRRDVSALLRREEDALLARADSPEHLLHARGCLVAGTVGLGVGLTGALWGLFWIFFIDNPWALLLAVPLGVALTFALRKGLLSVLETLLRQATEQ